MQDHFSQPARRMDELLLQAIAGAPAETLYAIDSPLTALRLAGLKPKPSVAALQHGCVRCMSRTEPPVSIAIDLIAGR